MPHRLSNGYRTTQTRPQPRVVTPPDAAHIAPPEPETTIEKAARTLSSHPAAAIGAAFVVGLMIGKWVKRS